VIELPLIFVAGILGTAHCLGMCGPMALAIGGAAKGWPSAIAKQIVYTAGRLFSYGFLGSVAGFCGARLVRFSPSLVNVPATLAVIAGVFLIYQGLRATGIFRRRGVSAAAGPCLAGGFIGQFLRHPNHSGVFLAGVLTGFLPCGLLYGMLSLAMSTHSVLLGGTMMIIFGLGTAPAMMLAGVSGRLIGLATRQWIYAAAAWCLVLTGVVSVARGVSFISSTERSAASCPLCTH
jgi:sulfite exporter TauE/SafE